MADRHYLELLSKEYSNRDAVSVEIINLQAICQLPKGTEYFFSDLHGEADAFLYLVGTASGIVREKIETLFQNSLPEADRMLLGQLIYNPKKLLGSADYRNVDADWYRITIFRLVQVCKTVSSKYTRSKVRKKMPSQFSYILDELLHADTEENKEKYFTAIIDSIIDTGMVKRFIIELCGLIRKCAIDQLHIIGDIFDRGPHADWVMEELISFGEVDVQWGNHDIHWMGAVAGNETCMANVVRLAISYNNFDLLEDGYGINLRPLSTFAMETYRDDPCLPFRPHLLDENLYDSIDVELAAKMHKAIAIIQFKLEGQLIARHPEYEMEDRSLLPKIDFDAGEIELNGVRYPLRDTCFPTIDPSDPLALNSGETELVRTLSRSFTHNSLLKRHIRFLYNKGSLYKIANENLLFHGCVPMEENGDFSEMNILGKNVSGRSMMDFLDTVIRNAFYLPEESEEREPSLDFMWYLWCGRHSPVFGKNRITTFERYFIEDKSTHAENSNPYYRHVNERAACEQILREFSLSPARSRIINGHGPVRSLDGESPVKGDGLLFVIDGGISKAYQGRTGIGGYTLISNSHYLALAEHRPFAEVEQSGFSIAPAIHIVERFPSRIKVMDTDTGKRLLQSIEELTQLLTEYREGELREKT